MHLVTVTKCDLILFTSWYKTCLTLFLTSLDNSSFSSVSFWILLHYTWKFFPVSSLLFFDQEAFLPPKKNYQLKSPYHSIDNILTVKYLTTFIKTMLQFIQKEKLADWGCSGSDEWTKKDPIRKEMGKHFW